MRAHRLTRRELLMAGAAVAAQSAIVQDVAANTARRALIPYGAAVMISDFRADADLRAALVRHCDLIVPMNELKWDWVRQNREGFRFENADDIIGFARRNGKSTHGHTLLWGDALPAWVRELRTGREAERALVGHIETVLAKYAGLVPSWDVVNEVIAHEASPANPWRDTVWHRLLGPRLVDLAFATAARADPKARLALNDYDFENPDERTAERRRQALRIVRDLQARNIPIHEIGMQAHLYGERPLDVRAITAFCRELGRLGVAVRVTELDIIDWKLPGPAAERDRRVAELTRAYLEAVIEGQSPQAIITWGLSDRSTWINDVFKRQDGLAARPLPLDVNLQPKPMFEVIQAARRLPDARR